MHSNLYHNRTAQWLAYIAVFAVIAALPFFLDDPFTLNRLARYAVLATLALSVTLVWGYGGILSLGQGIAFGLAAYGMAMTMQMQFQGMLNDPVPSFMRSNGLDDLPWIWQPFASTASGLFVSLLVPTVFFALFGTMMFQARVAGVFVAIMTLAMLAAFYAMSYDNQAYTGGFNGISPPLPLDFFGVSIDPFSSTSYWICVGFLASATILAKMLMQSQFGIVIQAIRDDPERARFTGYNVALYQTVLFAISGLIAAIAGMSWVLLVQFASPSLLELTLSLSAVIWAAVGGRLSFLGAILGAYLINGMQSYLGDALESYWQIFLGAVFVLIVLFLPKGLIGLVETALARLVVKSGDDVKAKTISKGNA